MVFLATANNPSVGYPFYVIPEDEQLLNTHFGQFGDDDNLDMYAWPLLWTNSYTGKYNLFYPLHHVIEP